MVRTQLHQLSEEGEAGIPSFSLASMGESPVHERPSGNWICKTDAKM